MTNINTENTAILIIDIQEKLLNAAFNKEIVSKNAGIITQAAKILNITTFITEQYPKGLGETIEIIKENKTEKTFFYEKTAFNALYNQDLCNKLKNLKIKNIIIAGIETHICVYQTIIALLQDGYSVTVIKDCCGSRKENEYISALDILSKNGAQIKTTEMFLFELLKTSKHPNFKEIQALIK